MIDILNKKLKGTFRTDLVENHLTVDTGKKCRESLAIIEGEYLRILHWNHSNVKKSELISDLISLQEKINMKVCLHISFLQQIDMLEGSILENKLKERNLLFPIIKNTIDYLHLDFDYGELISNYLRRIILVENRNSIINDIL